MLTRRNQIVAHRWALGATMCEVSFWGTHDPRLRLNAICPYYTMFPLSFPGEALSRARPGEWVLDPFCGRGTTLFAARCLGLPAVGVDVNPVAVATARAKLVDVPPTEVVELARSLIERHAGTAPPPGDFFELAFHPTSLHDLVALRQGLLETPDTPASTMLRALILGVLHGPLGVRSQSYLSNQMPRTFATKPGPAVRYWERHGLKPPEVDVMGVVHRRAQFVLREVPAAVPGEVVHGDARAALPTLSRKFSWVVTSPPYLGMRTYLPDQWLRAWFLGGPPDVSYVTPHAIETASITTFVDQLAGVFRAVGAVCAPGARLVVRFGALPSSPCDPAEVVKETLSGADSPWTIEEIRPAGRPRRSRRQSTQMGASSNYVDEIDCEAVLR